MRLGCAPVVLVAAVTLLSCTRRQNDNQCVTGDQKSCPCLGGGDGVQVCQADGTYGACDCSQLDMSVSVDDMAMAEPPDFAKLPDMASLYTLFDLAGLDLYGTYDCSELNACVRNCTTQPCIQSCRSKATAPALQREDVLQSCFTQYCPSGAAQVCAPDSMGMISAACSMCLSNTYVPNSQNCAPTQNPSECHMCLAAAEACEQDGNQEDGGTGTLTRFFPDIQADLDAKTCTSTACHGTMGNGSVMYVKAMATAQADIDANYTSVMNEVNLTTPAMSQLLVQPGEAGSGHTGGMNFTMGTSDPTYQKWLAWITAGAPKQ